MNQKTYKQVVLAVMDGFGISLEEKANAVALAQKPVLDSLDQNYPFTALQASGIAVGLPWGEAGNSEVGHLTMGAGRVIYHSLPRIINAIHDGSFFKNEAFLKAAEHVKTHTSTLHLIGLLSSGSVHAYVDHLYALLDFAEMQKLPSVMIHPFMDGRDSPPDEGAKMLGLLKDRLDKKYPFAKIASVVGRSFAMDRDGHWDRTARAYDLFVKGIGTPCK